MSCNRHIIIEIARSVYLELVALRGGGGAFHGAGGGGGYSGGGGGSYNAGSNQSNSSGVRTGHGEVIITKQ